MFTIPRHFLVVYGIVLPTLLYLPAPKDTCRVSVGPGAVLFRRHPVGGKEPCPPAFHICPRVWVMGPALHGKRWLFLGTLWMR